MYIILIIVTEIVMYALRPPKHRYSALQGAPNAAAPGASNLQREGVLWALWLRFTGSGLRAKATRPQSIPGKESSSYLLLHGQGKLHEQG